MIPQSAADAITAAARPEAVPADALAAEYAIVRHRMVAFLNVFSRSLDADAANYLHYGATTVDIYDTAAMLQVRQSILLLIEDLRAIELQLIDLAETHRDTPMIGRTLGQHALPITFGKKVAGWIGENRRHIDRMTDLLDRVERSAIMKGAVGSYVGLGDRAQAVERRFGEELGLSEPYADDWHASRDVFAEYAVNLGLLARFYGRVGQEVFLLQMTDIAEVIEQRSSTAVGSSTMPHKNNPSLSEALIHYSRTIPALSDIVADDMINFFERDNTSRPNDAIGELSMAGAPTMGRVFNAEPVRGMDLDRAPVGQIVRHPRAESIDVLSSFKQGEGTEVVVEAPIFHHQHNNSVDSITDELVVEGPRLRRPFPRFRTSRQEWRHSKSAEALERLSTLKSLGS